MAAEKPPRAWNWPRIRTIYRAPLAVACLSAQFLYAPAGVSAPLVIAVVFTVYSLAALVWRKLDRLQLSLMCLFLETAVFIILSAYGADRSGWIGSMFYLYLMLAAAFSYEWTDVFIVAGASLAFFGFVHSPNAQVLRHVVLVSGLLACVVGLQKRQLLDKLNQSHSREQMLKAEAEKVCDSERQRIANDFHDGPLQTFIALQVRLEILGTLLKRDPAAGMEDLKELQQLAKAQVAEIRSFLRSMKPIEVDNSDLVASARQIVQYFQKDTGIPARFVSSEAVIKMPPETSHEAIQILREALQNVSKHSKASRVVVSTEQIGKMVEISVDDDGVGFSFSGSFTLDELDLLRLGPQSIKRRIRSVSGDLVIDSRPGHGASLKLRIPA
jgi:signal transduction histidine kinase